MTNLCSTLVTDLNASISPEFDSINTLLIVVIALVTIIMAGIAYGIWFLFTKINELRQRVVHLEEQIISSDEKIRANIQESSDTLKNSNEKIQTRV